MSFLRHTAITAVSVLLLVGVPVYRTGYFQKKLSGVDTVSSASVILDLPKGEYVALINRERHPDADKLAVWETFFKGGEIDYIFEDISCVVAPQDPYGLELAQSFQSRLPENQMKIRTEDLMMMLSKAEYGRFDVMLLSKVVTDVTGIPEGPSTLVVKGGEAWSGPGETEPEAGPLAAETEPEAGSLPGETEPEAGPLAAETEPEAGSLRKEIKGRES